MAVEALPRFRSGGPRARPRVSNPKAGRAPVAAGLPGLSIVLPCFNEEANVAEAVRQAGDAATLFSDRHEVIVVDDGSRDATARVTAGLAASDRRVRLVMHSDNRGYGAALRSGIDAARMPWVLLTDADLQFDLLEIGEFLPYAESSDLIVGFRIARQDPVGRRACAAGWNWLMRHALEIPVHDVDCAFKLVRRDLLERVELVSSGAMISAELIAKSLQSDARLIEVGVRHRPRQAGEQSGASPRVVMRAFQELLELRDVLRPPAHSTG
jgi:glycosyltransferase involved in cell wall biosynthesis